MHADDVTKVAIIATGHNGANARDGRYEWVVQFDRTNITVWSCTRQILPSVLASPHDTTVPSPLTSAQALSVQDIRWTPHVRLSRSFGACRHPTLRRPRSQM